MEGRSCGSCCCGISDGCCLGIARAWTLKGDVCPASFKATTPFASRSSVSDVDLLWISITHH